MNSMRALIAYGAGEFGVETIDIPTPGLDDVLIKVHACSLCGSDLKLIAGQMGGVEFPLVPGHEWSGIVVDASTANRHLVGRGVIADILQNCGRCDACNRGRRNLCNALIEPGLTSQGAFAQYIAVPAGSVHVIPDTVTLDEACLAEPLSVVQHALSRVGTAATSAALVVGGGGIGLITLATLKKAGVDRIGLVDPHPERRDVARQLGSTWTGPCSSDLKDEVAEYLGEPPSLVINCASSAGGLRTAIDLCASGGSVCQVGYTSTETVPICPSDIAVKELQVFGSLSPTYPLGLSLQALQGLDLGRLLTHSGDLDDFPSLFELSKLRRSGAVRVLIRP